MFTKEFLELIDDLTDFRNNGIESNELLGYAGSGKATFIKSLAKSPDVQRLLQAREGIRTPKTLITVTNNENIPEDKLFVQFNFISWWSIGCDAGKYLYWDLFDNVLYSGLSAVEDSEDLEEYLLDTLNDELRKENKLKVLVDRMSEEDFDDMVKIFKKIPFETILKEHPRWYDEIRKCTLSPECESAVSSFHIKIIDIAFKYATDLAKQFEEAGFYVKQADERSYMLLAEFSALDYDNEFYRFFIEDRVLPFLVDRILIFRGNDNIFTEKNQSKLFISAKDAEYAGGFNANGLHDLFEDCLVENVLICVDCNDYDASIQQIFKAVFDFEAEEDLEMDEFRILFTHFDTYVQSLAASIIPANKFSAMTLTDWESIRNLAKENIEKAIEKYCELYPPICRYLLRNVKIAAIDMFGTNLFDDYDYFKNAEEILTSTTYYYKSEQDNAEPWDYVFNPIRVF